MLHPFNTTPFYLRNASASTSTTCWTWSASPLFRLQILTQILPNWLILLVSLLNLRVFAVWRRRPLFLLHHIILSAGELSRGIIGTIGPINRLIDPTLASTWPNAITLAGGAMLTTWVNGIILLISLDRWLFVEFPRFYRQHATKRTIILSHVILDGGIFLFYTTFYIVLGHSTFMFPCNREAYLNLSDYPWATAVFNTGFFGLLTASALPQLRLIYTALRLKWHGTRGRVHPARGEEPASSGAEQLADMAKDVLAGAAVVTATVVCQVIARAFYSAYIRQLGMGYALYLPYLFFNWVKDLLPFFFYVAFYPTFRRCLRRCWVLTQRQNMSQ